MKSFYIALIRHGLCEGETEGRYIGHTDAPLTGEGRRQLDALRGDCRYPEADALFTSPLARCRESAALLYPDNAPIEMRGLIEYYFGEYENKSPAELERHPLFARWIGGEAGVTPPFGEALSDFQARICDTFVKVVDGLIKTGTRRSAIVTHGGVIMALLAAFGLPEAPMHEWLTPSGCGYTLRVEPSLWMRARKCEVMSLVPGEPEEREDDPISKERSLWLELEETERV
ncbi:MAG: histidine phosphatase family protein [Oscillospiraceae bacterium]|nr:histidine phosphatase family protein [Oscillospiraceae bacterium]